MNILLLFLFLQLLLRFNFSLVGQKCM